MKEENVEIFRRKLNELCTLTESELTPKITIDVPMPISYLSRELTEQLSVLEPFLEKETQSRYLPKRPACFKPENSGQKSECS